MQMDNTGGHSDANFPWNAVGPLRLMYQSVSWEYLQFLAEENKSDDWGKRLYYGWTRTGRYEPEIMVTIEKMKY